MSFNLPKNYETLIDLETAKLAKKKGFNWAVYRSFTVYKRTNKSNNPSFATVRGEVENETGYFINTSLFDYSNDNYVCYAQPTHAFLAEWLRVVHNLHMTVEPSLMVFDNGDVPIDERIHYELVLHISSPVNIFKQERIKTKFKTYDKAFGVGLIKLLKQIK